jgi:hypothetical protein
MMALAPHFAVTEIHRGDAACGDERGGKRTRDPVDEDGARGELRTGKRRADDRVVADVELDGDLGAARVVEAVGAYAETAFREIEDEALRFGAVVAACVKAQVPAADQAIHALRSGGRREAGAGNGDDKCNGGAEHGW